MKLPRVLSKDGTRPNEVVLNLDVPAELEAFKGHFPDHPILPGVVQIDWAVRFAALHLDIEEASPRDFQVKYRKIICPDKPLTLTLQLDSSKKRLSFIYHSGDDMMSSGQMKLETAP